MVNQLLKGLCPDTAIFSQCDHRNIDVSIANGNPPYLFLSARDFFGTTKLNLADFAVRVKPAGRRL